MPPSLLPGYHSFLILIEKNSVKKISEKDYNGFVGKVVKLNASIIRSIHFFITVRLYVGSISIFGYPVCRACQETTSLCRVETSSAKYFGHSYSLTKLINHRSAHYQNEEGFRSKNV